MKVKTSVARAAAVGVDTDADAPWVASCDTHGTMIASASRKLARIDARRPEEWCSPCREIATAEVLAADAIGDRGDCDCECEHNCSCYPEGTS